MLLWSNNTKYTTSSVVDTLRSKWYLNSRRFVKKNCGKPTSVHPTNSNSLFIARLSEGLDMAMEGNSAAKKWLQLNSFNIWYQGKKNNFGQFFCIQPQVGGNPVFGNKTLRQLLNKNDETHLGSKLVLMIQKSRLLQATEIQFLQNKRQPEHTCILTNLMLSLKNTQPAGYMFAGNRMMFLETDDSVV